MKKIFLFTILFIMVNLAAENISIETRYNYYTSEETAELLIRNLQKDSLFLDVYAKDQILLENKLISVKEVNIVQFPIWELEKERNILTCQFSKNDEVLITQQVLLKRLEPQTNAVKIDRLTGALIVHDLPFFPFGFYCYSPLQATLPEEEVVKGFNMISPYQQLHRDKLNDRIEYMNRCAELGMKVHYNLCSVGGGGGVGSGLMRVPEAKRLELLKQEVTRFKDHPALLAWYISDEPVLNKISVEKLEKIYNIIHAIDPYHPVSIVFNQASSADRYARAMDIIMADPYPIPSRSIKTVENVASSLFERFKYEKPVWIVPQAFGGNEWWQREPTPQEIRTMTYLAITSGATGIQYFIRHGLNSFPKSTVSWSECAKIAMEIAEVSPILLTGNKFTNFVCNNSELTVSAWEKDDNLVMIVVNSNTEPKEFKIEITDSLTVDQIKLPAENRTLPILNNTFTDIMYAMDAKIYQIEPVEQTEKLIFQENLMLDPSFENSAVPGVPNHCYARIGRDRGATYFVDSRTAKSGTHSLRLTTPEYSQGANLKFYKVPLKKDVSYSLSVWAKALPRAELYEKERSFWQKLFHPVEPETDRYDFLLEIEDQRRTFPLTPNWKFYSFSFSRKDDRGEIKNGLAKLEMLGKGTAWFDLLQVTPDITLSQSIDENLNKLMISLTTPHSHGEIYYTLNGKTPDKTSKKYFAPFPIEKRSTLEAIVLQDDKVVGKLKRYFNVHKAFGKPVEYLTDYQRYTGGGDFALVDGSYGSSNFKDAKWQGFIYKDCDLIIDLGKETKINEIKIGFLQNINAWIFLPNKIELKFSLDGKNYDNKKVFDNPIPPNKTGKFIKRFSLDIAKISARYVHITADNIGLCPAWHRGAGKPAWLFIDEIEID